MHFRSLLTSLFISDSLSSTLALPALDAQPSADAMDIDPGTLFATDMPDARTQPPSKPFPSSIQSGLPEASQPNHTAIENLLSTDALHREDTNESPQPDRKEAQPDIKSSSMPAPTNGDDVKMVDGDNATSGKPASGTETVPEDAVDLTSSATAPPFVLNSAAPASDPTVAAHEVSVSRPAPPVVKPESVEATSDIMSQPEQNPAAALSDPAVFSALPSTSSKIAREREDDDDDAPEAKRTKTENEPVLDKPMADETDVKPPEATGHAPLASDTPLATADKTPVAPTQPQESWGPMTDVHHKRLTENLKNLKKNKSAVFFAKPVDHVALNIPNYPNVIKHPMDISTIEQKLREHVYKSVDDFVADFRLMSDNAITFNGAAHAVGAAASNIYAHMQGQLKKIPKPGESLLGPPPALPKKPQKQKSFTVPAIVTNSKSRETKSKPLTPAVAPTAPSTAPIYAVASDGVPQIRRDSSTADGRPKREIHRPPPRDLPYASAKPRKKKYAIELKFCEHVIVEMRRPRYAHIAAPFLLPVDPVALAIPDYFKVIKKPMDLQTAEKKLKSGEYENAKEFEQDVRLIFQNCFKFNPSDNPVSMMGREYESVFTDLWTDKNEWVTEHAPSSGPQSPEYGSDSEDEDEEEETIGVEPSAALAEIQQQIFKLSEQAQNILGVIQAQPVKGKKKGGKPPKATTGASKANRKGTAVTASAKKTKVTKAPAAASRKLVTNSQKKEISERIGELPPEQVGRCANIIKDSLRRVGKHEMAVSEIVDTRISALYADISQGQG